MIRNNVNKTTNEDSLQFHHWIDHAFPFFYSPLFKNVPFPSKTKRTRNNYEIIAVQSPVTPRLPHFFTFFTNSQKSFTVYISFMADGNPDIVCKLEFIDKFNIASSQNLKK